MKKLLLTEAVTTIVVIGLFIFVFSFLNSWASEPSDKYEAAGVAAIIPLIAAAFTAIAIIRVVPLATVILVAGAFVSAFGAGAFITALVTSSFINIDAFVGIGTFLTVGAIAIFSIFSLGKKEFKNFFAVVSLIAQGLIIFGTFSVITFLF